jgi:hypothetical protein
MNSDPPIEPEIRSPENASLNDTLLERPRKNKPRRVLAEERKRAARAWVSLRNLRAYPLQGLTLSRCDRCRKLKEKCEGGVPCRRCLYYSNTCEFNRAGPQEQDDSPRAIR